MTDILVHALALIALPPLAMGVINKTKALFAGRTGAPILQGYYDIWKLLRKRTVLSETTTWIFRAAPPIALASTLVAGSLVPLGGLPSPVSFAGDFLLFAYLMGLARFFTASAALDTGSAFEGMGSAREVSFAALTEPALFFAFAALARQSGSLSLGGMLGAVGAPGRPAGSVAAIVMVSLGLFILLLAENGRIPVDDPNTHLELTMIHEAMVLDHGGPLLGVVEYAKAVKLFVLGSLLLDVAVPTRALPRWLDVPLFALGILGLSALVGAVESTMARLRMPRVPALLVAAVLLGGSAFVMLAR
jgi:formate hydrogenlyase subunit 4